MRQKIVLAIVAVVGVAIGYEKAAEHFLGAATAAIISSSAQTASDVSVDVKVLRAIRTNDIPAATQILESRLKTDLLRLHKKPTPPPLFPWSGP